MTPIEEVQALHERATTATERRTVVSRAYYSSFRRLVQISSKYGFDQNAVDPPEVKKKRSVHRRLFDFLRASDKSVLQRIGQDRIEDLYYMRIKADYRFVVSVTKPEADEAVLLALDIEDWIAEAEL